jgi:AraC family transcriptional regulator
MIEASRVVIGKELRPLLELIREASAALRDSSASADERIRRTDAILEKWTCSEGRKVGAGIRGNRAPRGGLAAWQVRRIMVFVEDNLARRIGVNELASLTGFSPAHFSRSFRVSFNETPHHYLVRMRVERALVQLQSADTPLSQVATECGFSDQSHFNRAFKKMLGASPGAWRRARVGSFAVLRSTAYGVEEIAL